MLIATAAQMVQVSSVGALLRATRGDAWVLVVTATATVVFDLVTAVIIGIVVAGFFALQQVARSAHVDEEPVSLDAADHDAEESRAARPSTSSPSGSRARCSSAPRTPSCSSSPRSPTSASSCCACRASPTLDATGASVLADTISRLESRGVTVLLSGVRPDHEQVLTRLGVFDELAHERHVFARTPDALAHARTHARREQHVPGADG